MKNKKRLNLPFSSEEKFRVSFFYKKIKNKNFFFINKHHIQTLDFIKRSTKFLDQLDLFRFGEKKNFSLKFKNKNDILFKTFKKSWFVFPVLCLFSLLYERKLVLSPKSVANLFLYFLFRNNTITINNYIIRIIKYRDVEKNILFNIYLKKIDLNFLNKNYRKIKKYFEKLYYIVRIETFKKKKLAKLYYKMGKVCFKKMRINNACSLFLKSYQNMSSHGGKIFIDILEGVLIGIVFSKNNIFVKKNERFESCFGNLYIRLFIFLEKCISINNPSGIQLGIREFKWNVYYYKTLKLSMIEIFFKTLKKNTLKFINNFFRIPFIDISVINGISLKSTQKLIKKLILKNYINGLFDYKRKILINFSDFSNIYLVKFCFKICFKIFFIIKKSIKKKDDKKSFVKFYYQKF